MGASSDAMLAYGICFVDGYNPNDDDDDDDDGLEKDPMYPSELCHSFSPIDNISIVTHCSYEYHMYILVYGNVTTASRGYPEDINVSNLIVPEESNKKLKDYIKKFRLEDKVQGDIGWKLFSYMG